MTAFHDGHDPRREHTGQLESAGGGENLEDRTIVEAGAPTPSPAVPAKTSRLRSMAMAMLKWLLILVAVVFLGREIASQWSAVHETLLATPLWSVLLSLLLAGAAVAASGEQQRGLLRAMGHDLRPGEWFHVFFLAQLGKYVPGTAWAYVSQMELSRSKGIRRANSVFVMLLGAGMTVLASFALGWVSLGDSTVSWLPTWLRGVAGGCGAVGTLIIAVRPQWIGRVITRLPDRLQIHGANLASLSSLWVPTAWTWLASVLYGLHILALSLPTSGLSWELVTQSIGGFPTAWVVGFLAFVVPAGVGVREVVLAAFLTPSLGSGGALAVVVVSRFVIIIAEALLMASTPLLRSRRRDG